MTVPTTSKRRRQVAWLHGDDVWRPTRPGEGGPSRRRRVVRRGMHASSMQTRNQTVVRDFEIHLIAVRGLAAGSVEQYVRHVRLFMGFLDVHGLELEEVTAPVVGDYLTFKAAGGSGPSIRKLMRFAIIALFDYLPDFAGDRNPARDTPAPRQKPAKTVAYSEEEADRILALVAQRQDPRGQFESSILTCLRYTGIRVTELCSLMTEGVDLGQRRLRVFGKGAKWRNVPIVPRLAGDLTDYLAGARLLAPDSEFLFANPSPRKPQIHPRTVRYITQKYGAASGVPGPHNPHRWRHTCATSLLRANVDLHRIQRILGHADIGTTVRYLHVVDDDLRDAMDRAFE